MSPEKTNLLRDVFLIAVKRKETYSWRAQERKGRKEERPARQLPFGTLLLYLHFLQLSNLGSQKNKERKIPRFEGHENAFILYLPAPNKKKEKRKER